MRVYDWIKRNNRRGHYEKKKKRAENAKKFGRAKGLDKFCSLACIERENLKEDPLFTSA